MCKGGQVVVIESGHAKGKGDRYLISRSNYLSLCLLIPSHRPQGERISNISHILSLVAAITKKRREGHGIITEEVSRDTFFTVAAQSPPCVEHAICFYCLNREFNYYRFGRLCRT